MEDSRHYLRELFIALLLCLVVTAQFIEKAFGHEFFRYLDGGILCLLLLMYCIKIINKQSIGKLAAIYGASVLLFVVISLLGSYNPGIAISIASTLVFTKIFFIFLVLKDLKLNELRVGMWALFIVHFTGWVLSIYYSDYFISLYPDVSYSLSTERWVGFSLNANRFAAISLVLAVYFLFFEKKYSIFLICTIMLIGSQSRSFFVLFVASIMYFSFISRKRLFLYLSFPVIFALSVYVLFFEFSLADTFAKISGTIDGSLQYIRAAMLYGGWLLALKYFPFGTGGGTFGSLFSPDSGVYRELGIASWPTVENATGIYDSGIGSMLGEYGFIGALIFVTLLWKMFSIYGTFAYRKLDIIFLLFCVIWISFFRQVSANFFYSLVILSIAMMITEMNKKWRHCVPSDL